VICLYQNYVCDCEIVVLSKRIIGGRRVLVIVSTTAKRAVGIRGVVSGMV